MKILRLAIFAFTVLMGTSSFSQSTARIEVARDFYSNEQFEEALEEVQSILNENEADFDALFLMADCHQKKVKCWFQ